MEFEVQKHVEIQQLAVRIQEKPVDLHEMVIVMVMLGVMSISRGKSKGIQW